MPVSRLFVEISGSNDKLNESMRQAIETAEKAGVKMSQAGQRFVASFQDALNPTKKLEEQIALLAATGQKEVDIARVMGKELITAAEGATKFGQPIAENVKRLADMARASEEAAKKQAELAEKSTTAGSGIESLGRNIMDFARNPLGAAKNAATGLLETMGPLAVGIGGIAAAAVTAGAAMVKMGSDAAAAAEQIQNLAASTGMTVTEVQALQRLGKETGVGDLTSKIEQLNIQLGRPEGGEFTEAILRMNIAIKQGAGGAYYLEEILKKLAEIPTEAERSQAGAAAFGRRMWHDVAPLVMNASRSITESMREIETSMAVMSEAEVESLTALDNEIDKHGRAWEGLKNTVSILTGEITLAVMKMIEKIDLAAPSRGMAYGISALTGGASKAAEAVPSVRDLGVMAPTTVQGQSYDDLLKETNEIERRLKVIAEQDAIATGMRGRLLALTVELKQVEKERQEIVRNAPKGLQFEEDRLRILSSQQASLAQAIAAEQARMEAVKKAAGEQEKIQLAAIELEQKLNDQATLYGSTLIPAAAKVWQEQMLPAIMAARKEQDALTASLAALDKMKIRPLVPEVTPQGQTLSDIIKDAGTVINKTIPEVVTTNKRGTEEIADTWRRQVSTIVTDWSRGIADIITSGQAGWSKLKDIFVDTGKSILRMLIEQFFNPLMSLLSKALGGLFSFGQAGQTGSMAGGFSGLGGLGGLAGGLAAPIIGGAALGVTIPETPSSKILGGIAGGVGAYAGYGAYVGATTLGGSAMTGITAAMASIPVWGWAALGATAIGTILYKVFTKSTVEAGAMEVARDLGGLQIGESMIKQFLASIGLTQKQAYDVRKDLLSSPLFLTQVAFPAAQAQGKTEQFLASLEKVTTAWGTFNLRDPFEQWMKSGSADALNKAFTEIFSKSQALVKIMPDFANALAATGTAADAAASATDELTARVTALRDSILATLPSQKDMFETFLQTGEILPELADLVAQYGGSMKAFQDYSALTQVRENLAGITDLATGLRNILPELAPIQQILSGQAWTAGTWSGLEAMGLDPSKLTRMTDLVRYVNELPNAISEFQNTGKLGKGGVLEQGIWQFGGAAGMTALQNYGQGFNTITPALLQSVQQGAEAAYKAERESILGYLDSLTTTLNEQIADASNDIVAELELILDAIKNPPPTSPNPTSPAPGGGTQTALPIQVTINGDVYGYDDFRARVNQAVADEYYRGGMAYLPA